MEHTLSTDRQDVLDRLRVADSEEQVGNLPSEIRLLLEDARLEIVGLRAENASLRRQLFAEPLL